MKPQCYFLIGPPGVGKTTWRNKNCPNAIVISSDQYIEDQAAAQGKTYSEVFSTSISAATAHMYSVLRGAIALRQPIVWDQTNITVAARASKITLLPEYNVIAVTFETSITELRKRGDKRKLETGKSISKEIVARMLSAYQRPTLSEGFTEIIVIKE